MRLVKPSFKILSDDFDESLKFIEEVARTCYKSEDKITDDSAIEFCRKLVKRGHFPMLEFGGAIVKFTVDRGVSHELVRHRLCSFAQESTRYCNYNGGVTFVIPPWIDVDPGEYNFHNVLTERADHHWYSAILLTEENYLKLLEEGWSPQQARSVLPNSLKTEIVVKANFTEWRHIFKLRCAEAAHPQMREVMVPLREEFRKRIPVIFDE